ncbi:serine/threonine protein kinase [Streptomyces sp. WM6386]|uniref:serine/threonine protein kinase n=1 Tax=Streptomyces sp. WM6386 TaxID=1415558 RepID=UPI0006192DC5|nr:serine/threonine protein kinase [Streptomyces sp. WM6386]KKD06437.1 serine/threonine protein kinase [Streptomyces sp. WM6386]
MSEADGGPGRRVVDGRFELEARLGGGGMGMVWRARDLVLHRLVAIKEVRPPDRDLAEYDPEAARMLRERVLREARALARIDHPNVVTIHHIVDGGEGTYPWIVMELVGGGSLADRLAQGPMPPAEAARIGRGVLAALTAAHDAGIQHRDVKPANVLLRPDGRPVLTDFGIAAIRETTSLTATGSIIGTPDFMAPERISGHEGGPASDLWSLAMMLYNAVEGHHPLRRGSTLATLAAVLHEDVPPPVRAGLLGDVLMSVLVRDPAARASAAVLDRRLAVIESEPTTGPTPPRDEPTSYPLAAPSTPTGPSYPGAPATPAAFGPPSANPIPGPTAPQSVIAPTRPPRRRVPGRPLLLSLSGTSLVGAVALLWWLLPLDGGTADLNTGGPSTPSSSSSSSTPTSVSTATSDSASTGSDSQETTTGSMLTPANIRIAIKALERESGRKRFGDFSVYDDYVTARIMVDGSDSAFETYDYRPGTGAEKSIIDSTLPSGDKPFAVEDFNWDRIPALLEEAEKKLNVKDPETRYVLVRQPDVFNPSFGLSVYLSDKYSRSGYLETDIKGKVTDVHPAED